MKLQQFGRKAFTVEGVQVTSDNMQEIADWCGGTIQAQEDLPEPFIKVPVHRPVNEKQTKAFVGDWVLKSPTGFKVYIDRAFKNSFEEIPARRNVFENSEAMEAAVAILAYPNRDEPQELRTVDVPADETPRCDNCGNTDPQMKVLDKDRKLCRKCLKELEVEEPTTRDLLGFNTPQNLMGGN